MSITTYEAPVVSELGDFTKETGEWIGVYQPECYLPFWDYSGCS